MNKKQTGFTLIELVIVIVILGILAVTAAPRFIDIQSEARAETLQGVKGALQGASQLVFAKAAIGGVQRLATGDANNPTVTIGSDIIETNFGYPDAGAFTAIQSAPVNGGTPEIVGIDRFVDLDDSQLSLIRDSATQFTIVFEGEGADSNCFVRYTNAAASGDVPTISVTDTGC